MSVDFVLEQDLKWREAELASLKRLAINATTENVAYRALLRAMWALLYAHFEGFTKFCWDTVLDHIQSAAIPTGELEAKFALLALEPIFRGHRANLDSNSIWSFFEMRLPQALLAAAEFPENCRLETESNLWPNIFERESGRLGIRCEELHKHRSRIQALVARRNDIAHGKNMVIATLTEYHEYESATLCLMHELAIKSIEILDGKAYEKKASPP
ncbi:MAG: hypothetical protein JNJ71_13695 [Rubrivivax sp.]|nr:hypothetical protein [Rubrivivax sp.]